ncbi:hypothetical protein F0562_034649 [Nyssa sinensis]|uniref:peptidylprolyl isomerase n=1 Tax=Nyssa sinensis TaxID=561372 RepID=A0A5J5AAK1_9ASTE|nr:hypothetical protein F0562_034649 [Nyssa sinensis]
MPTITMTIPSPIRQFQGSNSFTVRSLHEHVLTSRNARSFNFSTAKQNLWGRLLNPCNFHGGGLRCLSKPMSAVGSETAITDPKDNAITVKNAKIVVESQDDDKIQVRVDLTGEETQKVFDQVLHNLARTAPPVPGFRRQKGGKTSKVPKSFLLQMLGEERVTKFVIQEVVSSTMSDYVKKENLTVKDKKINTIQTAEELKLLSTPGNEFGFSATVELEKSETETTGSSSSEI